MVSAICALHEAWDVARYGMIEDVKERYARWLPQRATDPRSVFLVAEQQSTSKDAARGDAGPLVGFLVGEVLTNIPIYRVKEYGFIHDMWVEPAARGKGIGRALVLRAMERFGAVGVTQVRLETARANEEARKLFATCGFTVATVDMLVELTA